jgi:transposase-like protein
MAIKGQKFRQWTVEEKYKIIEPVIKLEKSSNQVTHETGINNGLITAWIKKYRENGMEGLTNKKKPGNPLAKYSRKKILTKEEQLEYENMKLRIENEMLKKGFLMKEDGMYVKFMK